MHEPTLFETRQALSPSQEMCVEALRWLAIPGTTADVERVLLEHNIRLPRNVISKRLQEAEAKGHCERTGREYLSRGVTRTTWRRLP
jgi:hypothetical protein